VSLLPERDGKKWPQWIQIAFVLLGFVIFILLAYYLWIPLFPFIRIKARVWDVIGLVLYLIGFGFVEWARQTLGKYWGLSTSQQVKLLDDHRLIQNGPYAFLRHPMYFGAWVLFVGLTMLYPVWAVFLLFIFSVISFTGRARREESALSERFGEQWIQYKKRTSFLIPLIY
ncbi:MAG TPA: isoprenylcysteine carboxylmethyltransferase family protein, partial [Anaerolineales bacterium]